MSLTAVKNFFVGKNSITDMGERYPLISKRGESSVPGIFIAGNLACVPDIRAALNQSYDIAQTIIKDFAKTPPQHPVIIIGAGPAGLNIASELEKAGIDNIILERKKILSTIRAFKPELILYNAKTGSKDIKGDFPFQETTAGFLLEDWHAIIDKKNLSIKEDSNVVDINRYPEENRFEVITKTANYQASLIVIATGKTITLKKIQLAESSKQPPKDWEAEDASIDKENMGDSTIPQAWLKTIGISVENNLSGKRFWLLIAVSIGVAFFYTLKNFTGIFAPLGSMFTTTGSKLEHYYPIMYSVIVVIFGTKAIFRYKDRIQTKKYLLLMFFQVSFYCVIPMYILSSWHSWSLAYPWPLVYSPKTIPDFNSMFYLVWVLTLTFVALPIWTIFTGKQYCSWVCGCGGLAETLGDQWRHYSPKGPANRKRERIALWVLGFAVVTSILVANGIQLEAGFFSLSWLYSVSIDLMLTSIIPMALYPFLGGKIWCRYWCPTMTLMQLLSNWYHKKGINKYAIHSNKDRCISCNFCSRYCEVGIDVRSFALKGKVLDNSNSSCIGCGICLSVCPTDTLSFNPNYSSITLNRYDSSEQLLAKIKEQRQQP